MEQRAMTRAGPGYESRGRTDFEIFELRLLSLNPNRLSRIFKRHPGGQHGREHRIPAPVARQQPTGRRPGAHHHARPGRHPARQVRSFWAHGTGSEQSPILLSRFVLELKSCVGVIGRNSRNTKHIRP